MNYYENLANNMVDESVGKLFRLSDDAKYIALCILVTGLAVATVIRETKALAERR